MKNEKLPLTSHLEELRRRLIVVFIAVGVGFIGCYPFSGKILQLLQRLVTTKLVFITPVEAFFTNLKLALFGSVVLISPLILFQVWRFVSPGLTNKEKSYAGYFWGLGIFLFLSGGGFAYLVVLPLGLRFLLASASASLLPMLSVGSYVSFCLWFIVLFGLLFELPLVTILLVRLGWINLDQLAKNRKYAIITIFIVAAMFTPPDVFTQLLLAVPLILLYEISLLLARVFQGDDQKGKR